MEIETSRELAESNVLTRGFHYPIPRESRNERLETESRLPATRWPLLGEITGRDSTSSARGHKSRTCPETHFPTMLSPSRVCAHPGERIITGRDISSRASYDSGARYLRNL